MDWEAVVFVELLKEDVRSLVDHIAGRFQEVDIALAVVVRIVVAVAAYIALVEEACTDWVADTFLVVASPKAVPAADNIQAVQAEDMHSVEDDIVAAAVAADTPRRDTTCAKVRDGHNSSRLAHTFESTLELCPTHTSTD